MMLQTYAQRNKLGIPVYSSERQGPPHRLCFKAKVTVDEHLFESPGFYKTLKEAEHAVAQVALMSLSIDAFTEASFMTYSFFLSINFCSSPFISLSSAQSFLHGSGHGMFH